MLLNIVIGHGVDIPTQIQHTGITNFLKRYIDQCQNNHPGKCKKPEPVSLPKRVVAVGSHSGDVVKLVEDAGKDAEYLALSHSWGSGQGPPKTLRTNLKAHKDSIPPSGNSKTLHDAIEITRLLQIPYLWVDSLCIVQDDPLDWEDESAKMALIYADASLTIAASSAPNGETGLLADRAKVHRIQGVDTRGVGYKIYVREQPSHYNFVEQFNYHDNLNG
ncbi:hypothetical protein OEA41_001944 [Lepraria neglecta]|uniref:Heterokaryon incompatibility domain-containing protein n=1 Tax=Lepraria neglecta TaxID=209136 RepID=A0AAD9ZBL8_9LECA|nr:hypothetical protein OEA41_001944 [Lepraria neglecta]